MAMRMAEPEGRQRARARARAAVDRLHAAQLAALAAPAAPEEPGEEERPPAGRDAYGAQRQLLARLGEIGSLLARLGRMTPADAEAVEVRRRLVTLAVGCAITLAELVSLAFELEEPDPAGAHDGAGAPGRGSGASAPGP